MVRSREDFQANWRGARRYQFDEEYRLKKAALQLDDQPAPGAQTSPEVSAVPPAHQADEAGLIPPPPRSNRLTWVLAAICAVGSFLLVFLNWTALVGRALQLLW